MRTGPDQPLVPASGGSADRRPRAALFTLGCKLNQFETEQMREQLEAAGCEVVEWGEPADICILNSCTVTARADRDTRRLARLARRTSPGATVVVAGCVPEAAPETLARAPEIDLLLPNRDKARLVELLRGRGDLAAAPMAPAAASAAESGAEAPSLPGYGATGPALRRFSGHTRAFVKVQEGCDQQCAYCIIPLARGPARSVPRADVEAQVRALTAAGHPEIVLIGTHLGRYGLDLAPPTTLADLCLALASQEGLPRLRLSSIEPQEVSDDLARLVAAGGRCLGDARLSRPGGGKLCRHLHLPLQSGCDTVLARMGRPYRAAEYRDLVQALVARCPGLAVAADVIVGFPGETAEEFAETVSLIEALPLAYLHVFTYSPRPHTPAATMPAQVAPEERKRRNHVLRDAGERKHLAFARSQIGQRLEVVVERQGEVEGEEGLWEGLSDNYLRVLFPAPARPEEPIVAVRVTGVEGELLRGKRDA